MTGHSSQLGRALQEVYRDEVLFVLTYVAGIIDSVPGGIALDISDAAQVQDLITKEHPDVVINCAAITNVNGWIDRNEMLKAYENTKKNQYRQYLMDVLDGTTCPWCNRPYTIFQ